MRVTDETARIRHEQTTILQRVEGAGIVRLRYEADLRAAVRRARLDLLARVRRDVETLTRRDGSVLSFQVHKVLDRIEDEIGHDAPERQRIRDAD